MRLTIPAGEVARAALVVLGLGLGVYVLWHIHEVIFLLFLGILLATAIEPIVDRLRRGPFSRGTGVLAVYTAIVLILAAVMAVIVPAVAAQGDAFVASIPAKIAALRPYAEQLRPFPLEEAALRIIDRAGETRQQPDRAGGRGQPAPDCHHGRPLPDQLPDGVLPGVLLAGRAGDDQAGRAATGPAQPGARRQRRLAGGRAEARRLGARPDPGDAGDGVMTGIGFWIIGLPNPALLGILAGIAELVPMVGPFLAVAPAVLVALGISPWTALVVLVFAVIAQQIESNILVPRIMGHAVGVSPLTVVLGILIGAILYGLPGAFLAVPIAGAIQVIVAHAVGMEDRTQSAAHTPAVAREAAAEAAAGAAATATPGEEAEAAREAAARGDGRLPDRAPRRPGRRAGRARRKRPWPPRPLDGETRSAELAPGLPPRSERRCRLPILMFTCECVYITRGALSRAASGGIPALRSG